MTEFKSLAYFFVGLLMVMGVVGTLESEVTIELAKGLKLTLLTLAGFGLMLVGVSYANEPVDSSDR